MLRRSDNFKCRQSLLGSARHGSTPTSIQMAVAASQGVRGHMQESPPSE
jgi:hypothetical protein